MRGWPVRRWIIIFHVAGRAFVKDAYTPSVSLGTLRNAHFAKQIMWTKLTKKELRN
jgi:hypothetical protein